MLEHNGRANPAVAAARYDPYLFSDSLFNSDGRFFPSSQIATASDSVLTGLAQLGTYQTGTAHAFISLFDATHQYIVAEAVPSMPIAPGLPSNELPVPIALCGTAIPRDQGTCDHVLYLQASPHATDPAELPLSFVPNLGTDSRFTSRPYCQFGEEGQFYAAVPIRTRKGINIGAFCVMNQTIPEGWDDSCPRRLRDISQAVMEHLEVNRSRHSYRRNERMNTGLSSFIEGKATLTGWQSGPNPDAYVDSDTREGALNARQQWLEHQERERSEEDEPTTHDMSGPSANASASAGLDGATVPWGDALAGRPKGSPGIDGAPPRATRPGASVLGAADPLPAAESEPPATSNTDEKTPRWVFSKAANVIREAFEVEGCIFLDAKLGSYQRPSMHAAPGAGEEADASGRVPSTGSIVPSTSSSDELSQASPTDETDTPCAFLGFSTTSRSSIDGAESIDGGAGILPKRFLAKLLRRYPRGKIFNFDAIGELQSSDSSEEDGMGGVVMQPVGDDPPRTRDRDGGSGEDSPAASTSRERPNKRRSHAQEGILIRRAFPSARSVAFIPIWDSKKERWLAGGFVYTLVPTRVFSADGELSFFKAFASLIATEAASLETLQADQAKSDALGSLSHELRSPLHGIILATELLNDTELDVFQGNAAHTIEICCRTLLDTIDHLLDYSKVNNLTAKRKLGSSGDPPSLRKRVKADLFGKKQLWSNLRLDGLVEEVVESVFAGFNFQHMSIRQLLKQDAKKHMDTASHHRQDFAQAMEQLSPDYGYSRDGYSMHLDNVSVYLSIDPTCDWMFHLQPGAIRRIVMNLFGNALKYTSKGSIRISLTQATPVFRRSATERIVKLTVQDTGKGMTEDFLRYKLFKPFSQEDELATGTGLGLSLVKVIVSQLQGQISVKSQVRVGTTITVTLQLDQPSSASGLPPLELPEDDQAFEEQTRELAGLRVQISGLDSPGRGSERAGVEDICRRWLHLEVVSDPDIMPDIVLRSEDTLPESLDEESLDAVARLAKTPNVVVCQNALAAYQQSTRFETAGQSGIFDFISQP